MKICIFEKTPTLNNEHNKRIDAHYRNSFILANELKADLLVTKKDYEKAINNIYDIGILQTNSMGTPIDKIKKIISNNNDIKLFYISNEYTTLSGGIIYKYPWKIITNYEKVKSPKNTEWVKSLNINLLFSKQPNDIILKKYDCIYYGTFRVNRDIYFQKYFKGNIYLSTGGKGKGGNFKYFKHLGCDFKSILKLTWEDKKETLNLFRYSLYIEDVYTHKVFNNLANRWYEAGFCNNVVFFDVNCWNTIRKSEIGYFEEQIKDYIVTSYEDLQTKIEYCNQDFERHLAIQKGWRLNEMVLREEMIDELKQIITQ
jgi:hypothetical protein